MKIYVLDALHPAGVEYAEKHFEVVRWDDPRVKNWREDADAVMVRMTRITADDIAKLGKAKVICKQGVGYDTIDIAAAKARGIPVCRTPGVNSEAVAEMAMALALSVARRTTESDRLIRAGVPLQRPDILGVELGGKTVGIIGLGNIGKLSARKWQAAFDCKILFFDPYVSEIPPWEKVSELQELLPRIDLLTVHCPLNKETRGLVGAKELALMKPRAILVSTARGGIVDEKALYDALKNGRLFGAGLDVWDELEPPRKDHPLLQLPNVAATPHTAGNTWETQERSSLQTAELAVEVLQGKPARNRVA
jgi:D-3-phosphoglycerate dehydrogenase / 2-oxoglutarate reductase